MRTESAIADWRKTTVNPRTRLTNGCVSEWIRKRRAERPAARRKNRRGTTSGADLRGNRPRRNLHHGNGLRHPLTSNYKSWQRFVFVASRCAKGPAKADDGGFPPKSRIPGLDVYRKPLQQ